MVKGVSRALNRNGGGEGKGWRIEGGVDLAKGKEKGRWGRGTEQCWEGAARKLRKVRGRMVRVGRRAVKGRRVNRCAEFGRRVGGLLVRGGLQDSDTGTSQ